MRYQTALRPDVVTFKTLLIVTRIESGLRLVPGQVSATAFDATIDRNTAAIVQRQNA
jgi:hypothetical protein